MLADSASWTAFVPPPQFSRALFMVLVVAFANATLVRGDETLAELRTDVRTPPEQERPQLHLGPGGDTRPLDDPEYSDADQLGDSVEDGLESAILAPAIGALLVGVAAPFYYPHAFLNDSFRVPGYFARYPYQYDLGYMLIDPPEALGLDGPYEPQAWAARIRGEFGTGFDDLDWIGGHVLIDTTSRLGIDSDVRYVREDRDAARDSLWLGDVNVLYRFAQCEILQFHTGLGMNYLSDTVASDFGFNFTYGLDFEPVRPWIFSTELDLGTLAHASVVHVRTTAGANWGASEAFIGYDLYDIGSTQIQGLVAGVRIWF